jgi:hypothetical protein
MGMGSMKNSNNNHSERQSTPIEMAVVRGETSGIIQAMGTELRLADDTSYEQWQQVLKFIQHTRKKAAIYIADCIAFGINKWGRKKVDEALEQLELEATLVKTAVAITTIPLELRFDNLEGEHYVELAKSGIPKAQKIRWARIASEQRLTPSQLRFSIIEGEVVDRAAAKALQTGVLTIQGIRQSFDVWARRVGGIEGVKAMEPDHQVEIMEELDAICEFGMLLHDHLQAIQEDKNRATA